MVRNLVFCACLASLLGCGSATVLSNEEPYVSLFGKCYTLSQNVFMHQNSCWGIGGKKILSPKEQDFCFAGEIGLIEDGTRFFVDEISQVNFGTWGLCPQIKVSLELGERRVDDVSIPVCMAKERLSWLVPGYDYEWKRGDVIVIDSTYAKSCSSP
jgi:hypothetical protein